MTEPHPNFLAQEKDEIVRRLINLLDEYGPVGVLAVENILQRVQEEINGNPRQRLGA